MAAKSEISRNAVKENEIMDLFKALISDPEELILFLKYITKIHFYEINTDGSEANYFLIEKKGVLSPLLFTLLTHECAAIHSSNHIIKFADDMTVVGLISKNDESANRQEVQQLTAWCKDNNLSLNVSNTKEMVVDFRRAQSDHSLLYINGLSEENFT
ncbi:hypothetical protein QTP70_008516 [Hemibagrus guttatus]|uniref:Sacsin/Nov domain-containing protein n=1 Tax=Hemibagrus guttatus TaxID=175788 RepID=A0AAE0R5J8_9TELE|nr:hypothetical protein QTP70_008516 [Hemibagrus guttatus]